MTDQPSAGTIRLYVCIILGVLVFMPLVIYPKSVKSEFCDFPCDVAQVQL
jgi:hypothetical protein